MLTEDHIDTFWLKMIHMYGHKWTTSYGEADDGTWYSGLRDLTPEQIAHGMRECLKRDESWPPTLPEFRKLAKPIIHAYHRPFGPALPPPERDTKIAEREIGKMKQNLKDQHKYKGNAFFPGESLCDFLKAMYASGKSREEFTKDRTRIVDPEADAEREAIQEESA